MRAKTVQDTLNESYEDFEDEEALLQKGNKITLGKGLEPLTEYQMAACYLNAKNAMGRAEDSKTTFAGKIARKMNKAEVETDFQRVSAPRLADMLDRRPRTIEYTVSKFRLLLSGNREGAIGNVMYRKILHFFDKFQKMSPGEVHGLALEAIDPDADYTRSEEYADQVAGQSQKTQEKKKESEKFKNNMMNDVANTYVQYKPLGEERAIKQTLKALTLKYNISQSELISIIKIEMKEPAIKKIFNKYSKTF